MKNFRDIVDTFVKHPRDDSMFKLIDHFEHYLPADEDIAYLALCLSKSGKMLNGLDGITTADIPSTGGPSSLSTILCPLYLNALGYAVPKLGIPGRPAGGIDVLAQIQGYKIDFTCEEIEQHLKDSGYIHFLAANTFTPLDAILFSYRKRFNKISIPELAIASILSKKKAVAVSLVGLDVRVAPHGNFGTSFDIASEYAKRFCMVAKQLGLHARCFLSDASIPYQPYIGRGEALAAVYDVITDQVEHWLQSHNDACYAMVYRLVQSNRKGSSIRPNSDVLFSVFRKNLKVQGSSFNQFESCVNNIRMEHKLELRAHKSGFVHIDLNSLRSLIVRIQNQFVSGKNRFPDPCGIILKKSSGTYVCKDDILATVRCVDSLANEMFTCTKSSIRVIDEPISGIHFREVTHV